MECAPKRIVLEAPQGIQAHQLSILSDPTPSLLVPFQRGSVMCMRVQGWTHKDYKFNEY